MQGLKAMVSLVFTRFPFTFILCNVVELVRTQSYESVQELRTRSLQSYDPDMLPLNQQSDVLNINLTASVFSISEVDQVRGAITMDIMVTLDWYDQRLNWKPADHNGITNFSIKSESVWTPPLTVANPVTFTLLDKSWMQVLILYDGKVSYTVEDIIEFTCSFNMKFWPFDKHRCSLRFSVYGYQQNRMSLSVPGPVVNTDFYTKNGEWYLEESSFEYTTDGIYCMPQVIYTFQINRLPAFYMLTEIIPINVIGALTCLVFLLPSESGERISYSITIILSLAVFLTVTAEDLPKNSEPVPIMCLYILFNMIVCICSLILVIFNLILYHRCNSVPVSKFYKTLARLARDRKLGRKDENGPQLRSLLPATLSCNNEDSNMAVTWWLAVSSGDTDNVTWKNVSESMDKLLFCGMVVITYTPSIIILIYIATASNYDTT